VNAPHEAVAEMKSNEASFDLEAIFLSKYGHIVRVIARVLRDHARSEELAVEAFLKLWRNEQAHGEKAEGWLYRTAVRMALDELRRQARWTRYERLLGFVRRAPTPEETLAVTEEQERVRSVLGVIEPRQAEFLVLRSHGLSYDELASALDLIRLRWEHFSTERSKRSERSMLNAMEKNSEMPINRWVDEHLMTLSPESEWEPNAVRGLAHLQERLRNGRGGGKRWT
jgi:RNA polymerase sigma factor (sigma-70 family)